MEETWFSEEVFTFIPSSDSRDKDDLSMCWGIKNDLHLNLKLREWVERLEAEVHLADVYDEIPQKNWGEILKRMEDSNTKDGNWAKFRYNSNRKEIIDTPANAFKSIEDILVCDQEAKEKPPHPSQTWKIKLFHKYLIQRAQALLQIKKSKKSS